MPKKKSQKHTKSTNPETQFDPNEIEGLGVEGQSKELKEEPKSLSLRDWVKQKGELDYPGELKVTLEKPKYGKLSNGSPYYFEGRVIGFLVIK